MRAIRILLILLLSLGWAAAAHAQVQITFYSKDFASTFPHAFVRLTGTDDATGQQIDENYGFTPVALGPGILFGSVQGMIESENPEYVARSVQHFTLPLSDEQYHSVIAIVEKWRDAPQPSYRLKGRNCIDFVAEIATSLGLQAPVIPKLMKKPRSYLDAITELNSAAIANWTAPASALSAHNDNAPAAVPAPAAGQGAAHH